MKGIYENRLAQVRQIATILDLDVLETEARYFDFAAKNESRGNKTRCYRSRDYIGLDDPKELADFSRYGKRVNILAVVNDGDNAKEIIEGSAAVNHVGLGMFFRIETEPGEREKLVSFHDTEAVYIEEPANYKETGYILNSTGNSLAEVYETAFYEDIRRDDAKSSRYKCRYDSEKDVPDSIKRLCGETVLATVYGIQSQDRIKIKGTASYESSFDKPTLSIKVDEKINCLVALKDLASLDVKEKEKDLLEWRPIMNRYTEVPKDIFDARINALPEKYRKTAKKLLTEDKDFEFAYFGGDDGKTSYEKNLAQITAKIASHGYDAETCLALTKGSGWYHPGFCDLMPKMAEDAIRKFNKTKAVNKNFKDTQSK